MFRTVLWINCLFLKAIFASFLLADNCRVFCDGPLLETVQNAHLYLDSKDFVDMPIKYDLDTTLLAFTQLANKSNVAVIRAFVEDYFLPPGAELKLCYPSDFQLKPETFLKIKDSNYRQWAYDIHAKWKQLCREVKGDVQKHSQFYSLISVPHPFIAPGGRFREFYYWDTYWIIKGLLASEMNTTAKNMIRNLADMVRRFGFVPNGGRIYYLRRSQPPLFAGCVYEYYAKTGDLNFVQEMLPWLERESKFWTTERMVKWETPFGDTHELFQYRVYQDAPRPESFKEDMFVADHTENVGEKIKIWSEIAAACESGWDFSTRWFADDGPYKNTLRSIRTSRVVPVDLNAFLCWNYDILAEFHSLLNNGDSAEKYIEKRDKMKAAMKELFWDEEDGVWYDLDLDTMNRSKRYYPSNLTPLFAKCFDNSFPVDVHRKTAAYLQRMKADQYPGGIPSSFILSGEQWDSPNGWAPTNHIIIEGLRKSRDLEVQETAYNLAKNWVETNYRAFAVSGKMFEKYNVEKTNRAGRGGEYEVQEGFGWSNGVILDLLITYGDRLQAPEITPVSIEQDITTPTNQ